MNDSQLYYDEASARRRLIQICVRIAKSYGDELDEKFPSRAEFEETHGAGAEDDND